MKLLSIEIPTCSPDMFEKFYKDNFRYWSKAKDKVLFNINFQRYTDEEISKYVSYAESLGLEVHYCKSEYVKGSAMTDVREKTHQIYPHCPFNMIYDDDIAVLSETYVDTVMKLLDMMVADEKIGVTTIRTRRRAEEPLIFIDKGVVFPFTYGGVIFRNREDKRLCPPEYVGMVGTVDAIFILEKMSEGYKRLTCKIGRSHFNHYELRVTREPGAVRHEWTFDESNAEVSRLIKYMSENGLCDLNFKIPQ